MKKILVCAAIIVGCLGLSASVYGASKPTTGVAAKWGQLKVKGTNVVNSQGSKVQLKGVSTHGIAWFPQYVNKAMFSSFKRFGANTIRLALYSDPGAGFRTDLYKKVDEGVKFASELGMYVIIDWHILGDGNPNTHKKAAIKFFTYMAKKYKNNTNVIYEICNEPNGNVTWEKHIKPYAKSIIKIIRAYDKKAIIIVGTPTWSQDVDIVAKSPITGESNIMYALHFYAATHKDWNREKVKTAYQAGLPIFVSEFSICDASGSGFNDYKEAAKWMKMIKGYKLPFVAWSMCNKNETSALIKSSCQKTGKISKSNLSKTGKWLIKQF